MRAPLTSLLAGALATALLAAPVAAQDATTTTTAPPTSTTAPAAPSTAPTSTAAPTTVPPTTAAPVFPNPQPDLQHPGVYIQEINEPPTISAATTGVTAIVGAGGAAAPTGTTQQVTSMADFAAAVPDPSAALQGAVEQFFAQGGGVAFIVLVADDSADSLLGALSGPVAELTQWDLLVVPAMAGLGQQDWTAVASAMGRAASNAAGTALLDPPTSVVSSGAADWVSTLGGWVAPLRGADATSMAMMSSGVVADGTTVSAAAAFAGLSATVADQEGVWVATGGPGNPLVGVEPAIEVDNTTAAALHDQGINPIMSVPHVGTVVMGDLTLRRETPDNELNRVQTVDLVGRSIRTGLQPFVFAPNEATTWSVVASAVSGFLDELYQEGALLGDTAADAYSVKVGLGSSMTAEDVLNGMMIVLVQVSLEEGPVSLTFSQQMVTTG